VSHPPCRRPRREGDLALFETGAIVFRIAEHHAGLLPKAANARARAITWMFAALNTVKRITTAPGLAAPYLGRLRHDNRRPGLVQGTALATADNIDLYVLEARGERFR
jgi:glutathione S-transferase